ERQLPSRRAGAVAPLAILARGVARDLRSALVCVLRAPAVATGAVRDVLVPLRRSRADLPRDAALDSAGRDDARRRGAVLLDGAHARGGYRAGACGCGGRP